MLLVGGLLLGGGGWSVASAAGNELLGLFFGFLGLMTVLSGGMLMQRGT
ncbi:hypothetical protein GCM10010979_17050 [Conyzicola nivalis]|uniref:Uncharacterized protein n=2 Tax=Conyzicola nivalis TaxID=1477021 RepID=A0A916SLB4_9MICO|nr:hypothetical protein GCM10010979_17050 [Conyzicola nivalis]